jgi:small subunit ribosomal protein S9
MADEERQDLPEGQEPEGQEPEGREAEGREPEGREPEGQEAEGREPEGQEAEGREPEGREPESREPESREPEGREPEGREPEGGAPGEPGEAAAEESAQQGADTPTEGGDTPTEGGEDAPPAAEQRAPEEAAPRDEAAQAPRRRRRDGRQEGQQEEVIPGAHLEPDLVLEEEREAVEGSEYAEAAEYAEAELEVGDEEPAAEGDEAERPVAREPLDLAADARYAATGKRKTAVARVTLRPGDGVYTINGRHLDQFFPRVRLQRMAQQPLETAGYNGRMDVVARIHGGGVSAQAGALRHGIARALVEADPNLRLELKRRGFLTRDPREKERKKAGLKKARKRPQFSKR